MHPRQGLMIDGSGGSYLAQKVGRMIRSSDLADHSWLTREIGMIRANELDEFEPVVFILGPQTNGGLINVLLYKNDRAFIVAERGTPELLAEAQAGAGFFFVDIDDATPPLHPLSELTGMMIKEFGLAIAD